MSSLRDQMRRLKLRRKERHESPRTANSGLAVAATSAESAAPSADDATTNGPEPTAEPTATHDPQDSVQRQHSQFRSVDTSNLNPDSVIEDADPNLRTDSTSLQTAPGTTAEPSTGGFDREEPVPKDYDGETLGGPRSFELWNKAFDALASEAETAEVAIAYKKTLAKVLIDEKLLSTARPSTTPSAADRVDTQATILNQLEDRSQRHELLARFVKEGQERVKLSKTVERAGSFADAIMWLAPILNVVLQIPHAAPAAIPWAGVLVGLQILANPAKAKKSNLDGISYVCSRMEWYCALSHYVLEDTDAGSMQQQLETRLLDLYKAILFYQMKSICTYYKHRGVAFLQGLSNWNDWDAHLKNVTDAQQTLGKDLAQLRMEEQRSTLLKVLESAQLREKELRAMHQDIHGTLEELLTFQKSFQEGEKNRKYIQDLFVTNPQDDMARIERKKGGLLNDVFRWILDTPQYTAVTDANPGSSDSSSRVLWIKGHAGMGKTMLMIGIIRELSDQILNTAPSVAYYFCQGTDESAQNSGTAVLRALIWMLLAQQPHLMTHLRSEHERMQQYEIFTGNRNAREVVSRIFKRMLKDASPAHLFVDALDECDEDLDLLLDIILGSLEEYVNIKWIVSSRPEIDVVNLIQERATKVTDDAVQIIDLGRQNLHVRVNAYIKHRLSSLEGRPGYTKSILTDIATEIQTRSEKTFLWVSLVFGILDRKDHRLRPLNGAYALKAVKEMPSGLTELYDHMMTRIEKGLGDDPQYCKKVLSVVAVSRRPLRSDELAVVCGFGESIGPEVLTIVENCGSFLSIESDVIALIHQSAKEYLLLDMERCSMQLTSRLQVTLDQVNLRLAQCSVSALTERFESRKRELGRIHKALAIWDLLPVAYSCIYWMDHIRLGVLLPGSSDYDTLSTERGELINACIGLIKRHFLQWVEYMAILGQLGDGNMCIETLDALTLSSLSSDSGLDVHLAAMTMFRDAKSFIDDFKEVINEEPLQVYGAALAFSAEKSWVRTAFWHLRLPFLNSVRLGHDVLGGYLTGGEPIVFLHLSADLTTITIVSNDATVRQLDVGTHQCLRELVTPRLSPKRLVAIKFTETCHLLAMMFEDDEIHVFDIATENRPMVLTDAPHSGLFRRYSDIHVPCLVFSAEGRMLASIGPRRPSEALIWNLKEGKLEHKCTHQDDFIASAIFSQDGRIMATDSYEEVRLWSVDSGDLLDKYSKDLDAYTAGNMIRFDDGDSNIVFQEGMFNLADGRFTSTTSRGLGSTLTAGRSCISLGNRSLLPLPWARRPSNEAACDAQKNMVAIGDRWGYLAIIEFDLEAVDRVDQGKAAVLSVHTDAVQPMPVAIVVSGFEDDPDDVEPPLRRRTRGYGFGDSGVHSTLTSNRQFMWTNGWNEW